MFSSGIILPNLLTKDQFVDNLRARNINSASMWSASIGMLSGLSIDYDNMQFQSFISLATNIATTSFAYYVSNSKVLSSDSLSIVNSGGLWGTLFGFGIYTSADTDIEFMPLYLLGGQLTGLVSFYLLASNELISRQRMVKIDLVAIAAALSTYGLTTILSLNKETKWISSIIMAITAGYIAYLKTNNLGKTIEFNQPRNFSQSIMNLNFKLGSIKI